MSLIIPIAVILAGSIMLSVWFDKRIEETFSAYVMLIITVLYMFYLFDALIYGLYLIVGISICMFGGAVVKFCLVLKNERFELKQYLEKIVTPSIIIIFLVLVIGWLIVRNNIVMLSDPMRLWGAYPKALYYTDRLQIGENSLIFSMEQSYIPGMPLLVYFFEKLGCRTFSEPVIYFVYIFAVVICFLPALSKLHWRDWGRIPLYAIIILVLPLMIYNSFEYTFYFSLFIDPILGVFMGYLLFLLTRPVLDEWFSTIQFLLGLSMCTLLKDSAIAFTAIAMVWVFIQYMKKKPEHFWIKSVLIVIVPILEYCSWQVAAISHGVLRHSVPFSMQGLLDIGFIKEFIINLYTFPIFESLFAFLPYMNTFAGVYILIFVISILIWRILLPEKRRIYVGGMVACILMQAVYMGGYYVLCLNGWGHRIACFGRYMSAILLGQVVFLSMFLMWKGKEEKMFGIMPEWVKAGMALSVLDAVLVMSFNTPNGFRLYEIYEDMDKIAEDIEKCLPSEEEEPIKLFMVCDGYDWSWDVHQRVYIDLIGSGIQVGNYVTDCLLIGNMTEDKFKEELLTKKFDYVYLVKGNEEFKQQFDSLFYGDDMKEATLWSVDIENERLDLVQEFEQQLRW